MKNLKSKQQVILERTNSVYESIHKMGDEYRVNGVIVPKSLINQFVSKAKKEYNIDAKENFAEIDLAQMFVDYITKNYMNTDSLPVKTILGIETEDENTDAIKDEVEAGEKEEFETPEEQVDVNVDVEAEVDVNGEEETVSSEIQTESKVNESVVTKLENSIKNLGRSINVEGENMIIGDTDLKIKELNSTDVELINGDFITYAELEEMDANLLDDILMIVDDAETEMEKTLDTTRDEDY